MMSLLTPDLAIQALGVSILRIEAFAEPMYGASIVASGAFRGAGDTLVPSMMILEVYGCKDYTCIAFSW